MRRILLLLPFLLIGCDALVPAFDSEADKRVVGAYQEISELLAKADLGAFTNSSSYKGEISTYASIIGQLETAKLSLQSTNPTGDSPAAKSGALLVNILDGCLTNLKTFGQIHKEVGVQPNSGATQPVRVACDQTVKAVGARGPAGGS